MQLPDDPSLTSFRTPPHAVDAERALLGALMLDSEVIDRIGHLPTSAFYAASHREIYAAILDCLDDVKACDAITVTERLRASEKLNQAGGPAYVAQLFVDVSSAFSAHVHAQMIRDTALERQLIAATTDIGEKIHGPGSTREKIDFAQKRIGEVTENVASSPLPIGDHVRAYRENIEAKASGGGGLKTRFIDLDNRLSGLHLGDLSIVAGRPSMGKTAFAVQILENHCRNGNAGALLSMEMSTPQVLDRMVSGETRIPLPEIVSGKRIREPNVDAALKHLSGWPLFIDDSPALTAQEVRTRARMMKRKYGISMLVLDYLQLMTCTSDNRNDGLGEITRTLKAIAKELQIHVMALSQLSRKCEERTDKRPIMSDLRDSGNIEQDADVIMFVYREEQYQPNAAQWKGKAEILIRKNRQGETGDVHMTWLGKYTRFENFAGEWPSANVTPMRRRQFGDD